MANEKGAEVYLIVEASRLLYSLIHITFFTGDSKKEEERNMNFGIPFVECSQEPPAASLDSGALRQPVANLQ